MKPPSNAKIINAIAFFLSNSVMYLSLEFKNLNVRINVKRNVRFTAGLVHWPAKPMVCLPPPDPPAYSSVPERGAFL